jgi:hypothetical protein
MDNDLRGREKRGDREQFSVGTLPRSAMLRRSFCTTIARHKEEAERTFGSRSFG